ncbi:MAG: phosphate uptake regulator PhoU [Candidatus Altiarchaeia archaeon]
MEYRKIQVTGDSTYIISLPKTWVKKNKLDKGDVLSVVEKGDEVVLRLKEEKEKEFEVPIKTGDAEFLSRLLITKYIQGYDTVVFSSKQHVDPKIRERLIKTSSYLIGMEPFGESRDTITFRMLMKGGRNPMESIERMHDLSMLSLRDLLSTMESGTYDDNTLSGIINRDNEIDKFYFLIVRQISATGGFEGIIWVQVAKSIERISDHIESIAQHLKAGKRIKKEDLSVFRELVDLYGDVMLTLKNKDLSAAEEILNGIQKIRAEGADLKNNLDGDHRKNILVYASFRRIGEYISDMAESAINLS